MRSQAATVLEYLKEVPEERQGVFKAMREMVRRTAPEATESMEYGMPTYQLDDEMFCAFASQKQYVAFYFCETDLVAKYKDRLESPNCGKSCIRYRKPETVRLDVLEEMMKEALEKRSDR